MAHGNLTLPDRAKPVGAQQGQHLNAVAFAVAVYIFAELTSRTQCHSFSIAQRCLTRRSNALVLVRRVVMLTKSAGSRNGGRDGMACRPVRRWTPAQ